MNLVLHLPPEIEARLKERAGLVGKDPEELALDALNETLASEAAATSTVPIETWLREFDAWVSGHKSRNPCFDDSRESIYPDRW